ncbi:MAG: glycosyltransferase [Planctomycetes bacterium]|nr:glycosyltransferase [Planctomycetota bacterium]
MRILHLHQSDDVRRAGDIVAMTRLHRALQRRGLESRMLCGLDPVDPTSRQIRRPVPVAKIEALLRLVTERLGLNDLHCFSSFGTPWNDEVKAADVLHVQSIHSNYFSYLALPMLTARKPTIFTLHDLWSFTGHCAVAYGCERWETGCGHCPHLDAHPSVRRDATRLEWTLKNWTYAHSRMTIVVPSRWLYDLASRSMLRRFPIRLVPHGVDIDVFRPLSKLECRDRLGIPRDRNVLLFSAPDVRLPWKGADLLEPSLRQLPPALRSNCSLVVLGRHAGSIAALLGIPVIDLGFVERDEEKAIAYSAADVFVSPSRAETFGLAILESLACGTPVAAFRTGGIPDLVRAGQNGWLAEGENAGDLGMAIRRLLEDRSTRETMSRAARDIVLEEFSLELQVTRHVDLYREILAQANDGRAR